MHDADQPRLTHVEGRPMWVGTDGRMVPHVCGGDGPDEPPAPGTPPATPPAQPTPPATPPAVPPAAVDVAAITAQAKADAAAEFEAWLKAEADKNELEQMSEADRKVAEAAAATAAAATAAAAAQAEALTAKASLKLVAAGIVLPTGDGAKPDEFLAANVRALGLPADATDEQIDTAIATHKTAFAGVYAPAAPGTPPTPGLGAPKPPAGGGAPTSAIERGRQKAREAKTAPPEGDPFARLRSA